MLNVELNHVVQLKMLTCHKVEKRREYFQKRRREDRAEEDVKVKRRKKENKSRVKKKIEKQLILDEIEA